MEPSRPNCERPPEFIKPKTLDDLNDEQLELFVEYMQDARLHAVRVYEAAKAEKDKSRNEKLTADLEKQITMLGKEIDRADKVVEALKKRLGNINALRLQIGETSASDLMKDQL